ncbi:hypothetical protein A8C56_06750 [Niabella ginsenosidivorans]|uniref:Uncharacterized protein n=1 Tax=Niabella ginsenosidivorans TaxID=1176587 RepID=A0A1A9I2B3_9BACT|nr:hypothetical protein A8C56_06750 [Niabella ginsenosidivorans]
MWLADTAFSAFQQKAAASPADAYRFNLSCMPLLLRSNQPMLLTSKTILRYFNALPKTAYHYQQTGSNRSYTETCFIIMGNRTLLIPIPATLCKRAILYRYGSKMNGHIRI